MDDLVNPKTKEYLKLKEYILSPQFCWYYLPTNVLFESEYNNFGFYEQEILRRQETRTRANNPLLPRFVQVYKQILQHNNITPQRPYRINVNSVHPTPDNTDPSPPHIDHDYSHQIMIIYLTPTYNGHTIVQGEPQPREEDDILLFNGEHYHHLYPPQSNRRVVIVFTLP